VGLFTKNTMNVNAMTDLVAYTALFILARFRDTGAWPDGAFRTFVVNKRMEERKHQASLWKLSRLALVADQVAKTIAQQPEVLAEVCETLNEPGTQEEVALLAHRAVFAADLVS